MTTLSQKIAAASIAVGSLATDKTNTQQNYKYISADKVLERAGDALARAGIVVIPAINTETTEAVKTDKGGTRYDSTVQFCMTITDGETTMQFLWPGRGSDYAVPDKALYKAITSGHKYFLMKMLNIGVGNEDSEHEQESEPRQPRAKANTPQTTSPAVDVQRTADAPQAEQPKKAHVTAGGPDDKPEREPGTCTIHDAPMDWKYSQKTSKWYAAHLGDDGGYCFGKVKPQTAAGR